ncbi:Uncharacterised protein [uncultured Bacteroides sp.]|nr:Uncharacterised protein [uncultured Bacteroides sp.]
MEIILFDHIVNIKYHDKKGLTPLNIRYIYRKFLDVILNLRNKQY